MRYRPLFARLALGLCLALPACTSFGPKHVPPDSFNYNQAIGRSANEQMLLNIVRLRYRDVPVFLAVSSVLTQYVYTGGVVAEGATGEAGGLSEYSVGGRADIRYLERPTITYSPLSGPEFAEQLLTPIPSDLLFSLIQSGWPALQLLSMGLERLNHVENVSFFPAPSPNNVDRLRTFDQVVELTIELGKRNLIEMQTEEMEGLEVRYLVFEENLDARAQALVEEFKRILKLDPQYSKFRVTTNRTRRKPDEIALQVRSMLTLMAYVSRGVEIPAAHIEEKRAVELVPWADQETRDLLVPLRIYSSVNRPLDAFVAVLYQDHWFYITYSDHASKQAFGLLTYLFSLQAPQPPTGAPLLTVPTG